MKISKYFVISALWSVVGGLVGGRCFIWSVVGGEFLVWSVVFMVGAGGGRRSISNMVGGRCFAFLMVGGRCLNQYMVGGRWLTVGGLWSVAGRWFCTTPL